MSLCLSGGQGQYLFIYLLKEKARGRQKQKTEIMNVLDAKLRKYFGLV